MVKNQCKHRNVLISLLQREYSSCSSYRQNLVLLRNIVCRENTEFKQVSEHHSKHPITYEGGRLYFDNYRHCVASFGHNGQPTSLYKLPHCIRGQKIEDALYGHCSSLSTINHGRQSCRNSLFGLTAHNMLVRYDGETGQMLEEIYLSSKYKFKHLSWSTEDQSLLLKSTHHHSTRLAVGDETLRTSQNVFMALCLIDVFPSKFVGAVEIDRRIFGKDVCDAMISHSDLLIVMTLNGWVRMYNWQDIVAQNKVFSADLFKENSEVEGIIGTKPCGLPINIRLQDEPPVIFQVRCEDHDLQMGGIPWHYVMCPYKQTGVRTVSDVGSGKVARNGLVDLSSLTVEPEKLLFHVDDSGRLLHISSGKVRVLRICELSPGIHELQESFTIDAADKKPTQQLNQDANFTSSGRAIKRRLIQDLADCTYQNIQNVDYENELDLLAIVMVTEDADCWKAKICLHDNQTGVKQVEVVLLEPWNEFSDHQIYIDMDTIIHVVKTPVSKYSCYVYRLERRLADELGCNERKCKTEKRIVNRRARPR